VDPMARLARPAGVHTDRRQCHHMRSRLLGPQCPRARCVVLIDDDERFMEHADLVIEIRLTSLLRLRRRPTWSRAPT
jgi:hypothetical protein